ncbi:uncharacterized protein LOC117176632 [Belonocnema kinseyi]|uniref:uncharacterized protein LOC117176632 n=1 Tax=Belonocnema kinseyi TaxID=2817044 RepID=UPI00143CC968|nr:uncharacterized protein LOC117176632 [Belonocnema kinseyi]
MLPERRGFDEEMERISGIINSAFSLFDNCYWSVPTPAYPEPRITVSVHFCIEASKVKPSPFPVDVTYVFEGNKFVHHPSIPFQPKWLLDILDMKKILFKLALERDLLPDLQRGRKVSGDRRIHNQPNLSSAGRFSIQESISVESDGSNLKDQRIRDQLSLSSASEASIPVVESDSAVSNRANLKNQGISDQASLSSPGGASIEVVESVAAKSSFGIDQTGQTPLQYDKKRTHLFQKQERIIRNLKKKLQLVNQQRRLERDGHNTYKRTMTSLFTQDQILTFIRQERTGRMPKPQKWSNSTVKKALLRLNSLAQIQGTINF